MDMPPQLTPGGPLATSVRHSIKRPNALSGISKYSLSSMRWTAKTPGIVLASGVITSSYFLGLFSDLAALAALSFGPFVGADFGASSARPTARALSSSRHRAKTDTRLSSMDVHLDAGSWDCSAIGRW